MVHQRSAAESLFIRGEVAGSRQVWEPNSGALGMNNGPNLDAVSTSSEIPGDWFALRCHICCLVIRFHLWNRYCSSFFVFVVCFFIKISGILSKSQHVGRSVCKFNPAPHVWLSHEGTVAFFLRHRGHKRGRFVYLFDLNRPHPMPFKSQHECGIRRVQLRLIFGSMAAFIWPSS